jgi:hypothetical protein
MTVVTERRTLLLLLLINATMFVVEMVTGWIGDSMGLIADALDMLADAFVYGVALWAVGSSARRKVRAATASGVIQLALAFWAAIEVLRRFFEGSDPVSSLMIGVSTIALAANAACVWLLRKHRHGEIHMRASWIFSTTDVQVNVGVILAGLLVMTTGSPLPDLVIGSMVCGLVVRGGIRILREAAKARADAPATPLQPGDPPVACHLTALDATQRKRQKELLGVVRGKIRKTVELPNGYALQMPADQATVQEVVEWISLERRCCGFAEFAHEMRPDDTFWVTVTGPSGAKEVLAGEMGLEVPSPARSRGLAHRSERRG